MSDLLLNTLIGIAVAVVVGALLDSHKNRWRGRGGKPFDPEAARRHREEWREARRVFDGSQPRTDGRAPGREP